MCNVLIKYKPIVSDKLSAAKNAGGGPAEAVLTAFELKNKIYQGKETFEGLTGGIDISTSFSILTPLRLQ